MFQLPIKAMRMAVSKTSSFVPSVRTSSATTDRQSFKPGNFTEQNIPNCLRKIRNEYRKDPVKAWDEQMAKENENGNDY